jgi:hypothetical protein
MIYRREPQGNFYARREVNGKDRTQTLDTTDRATAIARARAWYDEIITAAATEKWATLDGLRSRSPWASMGDICTRYTERAPTAARIQPRTAAGNVSALRSLLRLATGSTSPDDLRADVLNENTIRTFIERSRAEGRSDTGTRSTLAQARSILAPSLAYLFADLKLPDLTGWRVAIRLDSAADRGFTPIPEPIIAAMENAATALRSADPGTWSAYMLMARLGLRNSEVERARRSDIHTGADGRSYLHVTFTKNDRTRQLYLAPDLESDLRAISGAGEHLIPARTPTERHNITHREINRFVTRFLPDRRKKAYELRKWAGSIIWTRLGREAAAAFLGDRTDTVESYYAAWLRPVESVTAADFASIYDTQPTTRRYA